MLSVRHLPGTGTVVVVLPTVGGTGGSVLDAEKSGQGVDVRSLELAHPGTVEPDLDRAALTLLRRHFSLTVTEVAATAGRTADVVEARRPGAAAPTGRFWVDRASGLVLRREVYDEQGALLRSSAFVDIDPRGASGSTEALLPPRMAGESGQSLSAVARTALTTQGFVLPEGLPPGLELFDARSRDDDEGDPVLHLTYSDGLSTLSVFEQRGRLASASLQGWTKVSFGGATVHRRDDPPQRVVWESGGTVFTVLGDVSPTALSVAVLALPHDASVADDGVRARLGRGFSRLGSWLNPFD